jgi:hypothetical protein
LQTASGRVSSSALGLTRARRVPPQERCAAQRQPVYQLQEEVRWWLHTRLRRLSSAERPRGRHGWAHTPQRKFKACWRMSYPSCCPSVTPGRWRAVRVSTAPGEEQPRARTSGGRCLRAASLWPLPTATSQAGARTRRLCAAPARHLGSLAPPSRPGCSAPPAVDSPGAASRPALHSPSAVADCGAAALWRARLQNKRRTPL